MLCGACALLVVNRVLFSVCMFIRRVLFIVTCLLFVGCCVLCAVRCALSAASKLLLELSCVFGECCVG